MLSNKAKSLLKDWTRQRSYPYFVQSYHLALCTAEFPGTAACRAGWVSTVPGRTHRHLPSKQRMLAKVDRKIQMCRNTETCSHVSKQGHKEIADLSKGMKQPVARAFPDSHSLTQPPPASCSLPQRGTRSNRRTKTEDIILDLF